MAPLPDCRRGGTLADGQGAEDSLEREIPFWLLSFFFGESQHVSAGKDIVVTQPSLCCPKEDKPKRMEPAHF